MTKKLWTTRDVAEALCDAQNISTDYGLAKFLGLEPTTVSAWRRGHRVMSDDHAATIAPLIGEDPAWLALCLAVERVKSDTLAEKMRGVLLAGTNRVAGVVLGFLVVLVPYFGHLGIT
ncbi:MAG: hypothetical protein RLZZ182_1850 [Pseudomonadota bacterium]|jgi:plasmid maintenance system antidote protein VapI